MQKNLELQDVTRLEALSFWWLYMSTMTDIIVKISLNSLSFITDQFAVHALGCQ